MVQDDAEAGLGDAIADGEEAARLFESPVFVKAFKRVENGYTELWKATNTSLAEREMCWARIQVLGDVLLALNAVKSNGIIAAKKDAANARRDEGATTRKSRSGK